MRNQETALPFFLHLLCDTVPVRLFPLFLQCCSRASVDESFFLIYLAAAAILTPLFLLDLQVLSSPPQFYI